MAIIKPIKVTQNKDTIDVFPISVEKAILDDDGISLDKKLKKMNDSIDTCVFTTPTNEEHLDESELFSADLLQGHNAEYFENLANNPKQCNGFTFMKGTEVPETLPTNTVFFVYE